MDRPIDRSPATSNPPSVGPHAGPIRSTLSANTDMAELIQWFVENLSQRTADLTGAWRDRDLERLRDIAHQMKGSSAGFGFAVLGEAAASLERAAMKAQSEQTQLDGIRADLDRLLDLCARAAA